MKKIFLALMLFSSIILSQSLDSVKVSIDANSRYVWYGSVFDKNVIQPSVTVYSDNVFVKLWHSYDIETDVIIGYTGNIGPLSITPAFTLYSFSNEVDNELSVDACLSIKEFSIGNKLSVMSGFFNSTYAQYCNNLLWVRLGTGFANAQFNKKFNGYDGRTLSHIYIGAGINYEVLHFTIRPLIELYHLNDKITSDENVINLGIGITYTL